MLLCGDTELTLNGDMLLEKILEEDSIYGDEQRQRCDSISPVSNDKRYLLGSGQHHHITRI